MAESQRMTVDEVVAKLLREEHVDFVRESLRWVVGQLMEAEVSELVGAEHGERTPERLTHRNGYRSRCWDTRAGEIELQIPKLRRGSYFPSFLEPRKRSEQALLNVVQQAYVCASPPARSTSWSSRWGCGSPARRSRASPPGSTSRSKPSAPARWRATTPTCGWTPRSRRSATAAGCGASAW